jgi:hypothetical protein
MNSVDNAKRLAAVALTLTFAGASATSSATSPSPAFRHSPRPDPAVEREVGQILGQLPLSFEANQGQTDPRVRFFSRGHGYSLFLTSAEAVLALRAQTARAGDSASQAVLRMTLIGANPSARVSGMDELPGKSNYLAGHDRTHWRTGVPTYAKVSYEAIYPGVDLVYYGNGHHLEYDFIVAPGANPGTIALRFEGARDVVIDERGDLVLRVADSEIRQPKPVIYQEIDGARQQVEGRYVMIGTDKVGFDVAKYDVTRPLVIDPMLIYSTYLGGNNSDIGQGVAVAMDSEGNAYITGSTAARLLVDYPTTPGAFDRENVSGEAFVTKLNPTGSALVYSTFLGGNALDAGSGIAVDDDGHAYVTGGTQSADFPTTPGAFDTSFNGGSDAFVTKLNRDGSDVVYSTYLGGSGMDNDEMGSGGIAVDRRGQAFVAGTTGSIDFPTTKRAFQGENGGLRDAFVTKLNRRGSSLIYSTYLGGVGDDRGRGIALPGGDDRDVRGVASVTGVTDSNNFPTTRWAFQRMPGGLSDAFVTKLDRRGSDLEYSTYLGGTNRDHGFDIAVDWFGQAFVTGGTASLDFPTTKGAFQRENAGGFDAFVTKLTPGGSWLVYSTYLGGTADENTDLLVRRNAGIAIDLFGEAYVTGVTGGAAFPITANAVQPMYGGANDVFVTRLNWRGSALRYSTFLGGTGPEFGAGIALDGDHHKRDSRPAYVTGGTASPNFPTTEGAYDETHGGNFDAFVTKLETGDRRDHDDHDDHDDRDKDDD